MHDHNLDDLIIDNIEPKNSKTKSFLTIIALLIVILIIAIVLTRILLKTPQNDDLSFEQESAELIAPELKLQETPKQVEVTKGPVLSNIAESKPKPPAPEEKKPEVVQETIKEPVKKPTIDVKKGEPKPVIKPSEEPAETKTKKEPDLSDIIEQEVKAPVVTKEAQSTAQKELEAQVKAEQEAKEKAEREAQEAKEKAEREAQAKAEQEAKEKAEREAQEALQTAKPAAPKQEPVASSGKKYYVQVGSFKNQPSSRIISVIRNNGFSYRILRSSKDSMNKLLIGPYENKTSVNRALYQVKDRINKRAFVVKR